MRGQAQATIRAPIDGTPSPQKRCVTWHDHARSEGDTNAPPSLRSHDDQERLDRSKRAHALCER